MNLTKNLYKLGECNEGGRRQEAAMLKRPGHRAEGRRHYSYFFTIVSPVEALLSFKRIAKRVVANSSIDIYCA
ncbi:hypothetical protein [Scytonema hofmannii]|uniref:hypothetical protein n=1 Tax=Scytonema hofmannii TaxID=34078 RepID=UPI00234F056E|nr:hypothetical protein [Scytonema hofmannii]